MATLNRTFGVKNGIDVANTVIVDSNRNISNVINVAASYVSSNSAVVNGNVNVAGTLFTGNVIPHGNNTHNLGSPTARFKDVYLSGSTLDLDGTTISVVNGEVVSNTFNAAVSFVSGGLNVLNQANTARTTANDSYLQANSARAQANTARDTANDSYGQANTARNTANDSYGQANTARDTANGAYGQANTARGTANDSYVQANTAYLQANNAYAEANLKLNTAGGTITGSLNVANITKSNTFVSTSQNVVPPNLANTDGERLRLFDFQQAGHPNYAIGVEGNHIWTATDDDTGQTGFKWYGNTTQSMLLKSNGDLYVSNTVNAKSFVTSAGLNVIDQANAARAQANTARDAANSAANTVRVSSNSGSTLSSKQLNFINTASIQVTIGDASDGNANISFTTTGAAVADAYAQANAAYDQANSAYGQANGAYAKANAAYNTANSKVDTLIGLGAIQLGSGQTNNVWSYSINVNTASTSVVGVTKLVDSVTSTDTANAATANAVKWTYDFANTKLPLTGGTISGDLTIDGNLYLSQNTTLINVSTYQVEDPLLYLASNNEISDTVDIGFMGGKNTSGTYSHTGLIRHAADQKYYLFDGLPDEAHTNNVVNVASTYLATLRANLEANSILLVGNTVATQANLTLAHNQANTARDTANGAYAQANGAYAQANGAYAQANGAYASANGAYAQANGAYAQANGAYAQANAANDNANTRVLKSGDTMTGALTITTSSTGLLVGNAAVSFKLTVGSLNVTTNTVTTSSSGQVVLDKFPATDLASAKYFVQVNSGSDYHTTEVVLVQDATNVWITEYGSIQTGPSLGTFSADISSGDVRLLFTAVNNVNTIRSVRYGIAT